MVRAGKDDWKDKLFRVLREQFQKAIIMGIRKSLIRLLRIILLALVGAIVLVVGSIFLWVGFYYYLAKFLESWIACFIVGLISMLLGLILLLAAYLSR